MKNHLLDNMSLPHVVGDLPSSVKYPFRDIDDLIALLRSKDMMIGDDKLARHYLKYVGYSRLQTYWLVFQKRREELSYKQRSSNDFMRGTKFEDVIALSKFDKRLRLLFLEAIEQIELSLRVGLAYEIGRMHESGLAYLINSQMDVPETIFLRWREDALNEQWRSQEATTRYPWPIWIAVGKWSFGTVRRLFRMLRHDRKQHLAQSYYMLDIQTLESWLQCLGLVRNICAHHGCLWNMNFTYALKSPGGRQACHILPGLEDELVCHKIRGAIIVTDYLLRAINSELVPHCPWIGRMKLLWEQFPRSLPHGVSPKMVGFSHEDVREDSWHMQEGQD